MEFFYLLSLFLLLCFPRSVISSRDIGITASHEQGESLQTYIVHVLPPESIADAATVGRESYYKSFLPVTISSSSTEERMVYMYKQVMTGFAARLTAGEVREMGEKDGFLGAYPTQMYSLQTTHTPQFLGLNLQKGLWNLSSSGEGVIIGVIDTGVTPNHPSFDGTGMPRPPSKWKGRCDMDRASMCNNKLIGARSFINGVTGMAPIDDDGHGTHTASTAAGAPVAGANVLGNAWGTAVGMGPRAHIAVYKVCNDTCENSDILAAMDAAVDDGVDVLSLSLGGSFMLPYFENPISVGAFGAIQQGVFVSCSAGNGGPSHGTILNDSPWILTVAASTMDRILRVTVKLGNGMAFTGESLYQPQQSTPTFLPLVYAGASSNATARFCGYGSLDGVDLKGKVVLCDRGGDISRIEKGRVVWSAGGVGMILANQVEDGYSTLADPHVLPAAHVGYLDGTKIKAYINSSSSPTVNLVFQGTKLGTSPAPVITSFSSRGPSIVSPGILKPDITGPGVNVLAAWPFPVGPSATSNTTAATFNIISGTSMSAPHLSGIAALVKAAHPDWSPAAIKSAIMTTADITDTGGGPILDEMLLPADLFALGAGHVNPNKASDPGLVYDLTADDYVPYLCGLGYSNRQIGVITQSRIDCTKVKAISGEELNYPSISITLGAGKNCVTIERTVKNVGEAESVYEVQISPPAYLSVSVEPATLQFYKMYEEKKVKLTFEINSDRAVAGEQAKGYLRFVSDERVVRSPISVTFK